MDIVPVLFVNWVFEGRGAPNRELVIIVILRIDNHLGVLGDGDGRVKRGSVF